MLSNKKIATLLALVMISIVVVSGCMGGGDQVDDQNQTDDKEPQNETLKAAFIYTAAPNDGGWNEAHDEARKMVDNKFEWLETSYTDGIGPSDAARVIRNYAENDYDIIFPTSFGYMDPTIQVAKDFPNTTFEHCSGYKTSDNVGRYFVRIYQGSYLSGITAGKMTETDKLAYIAPHPIPEIVRNVNAFTLGVKEVNPDAQVQIGWTGAWYDPQKSREAALSFIEQDVDVIASFQNSPAHIKAAQDEGVYAIGLYKDMSQFGSEAHLTSPVVHWEVFYEEAVKEVKNGKWEPDFYWEGIENNASGIAPLKDNVPDNVKQIVDEERQELIKNETEVFEGPIKANNGTVMIKEGEKATDTELFAKMDWFVKGVVGKVPD